MKEKDEKKYTGLVAWFATNHIAANLLMIFVMLAGLISLKTIVRETFPPIDPKIINVSVPYPGASPEDIEESITRRVEEVLVGVQGIKRITSTASEGVGVITAEMTDFADATEVYNDIKTEVDSIVDFPPENAEEVQIVRAKVTSDVLSLVLYGDYNEKVLREWAEVIEDQLLQLPNVTLTDITGIRDREISIEISEDKLRELNLNLSQIALQIKNFSVDVPAGTFRTLSQENIIRVKDKRYFGKDFENIVIKSKNDGSLLRLKDIAKINDGFEDFSLINKFQNKNAVFIEVARSGNQDVVIISEEVKKFAKTINLPKGLSLELLKDETDILKDRMSLMLRNAVLGLALVFLSLVLFLDLKLAFWTAMGISFSFLGGFMFASFFGVTINMVSLFALIIVLGIVVDDAIVTGESIFSEQEAGQKDIEATMKGVRKIISPVTIGVLTTIAAFFPLTLSTGTLGQILFPIPVIVIGILFFSLIEAFFVLPSHLSNSKRWSIDLVSDIQKFVTQKLEKFINKFIIPSAQFLLKRRYLTVFLVLLFVFSALMTVPTGILKFVFFPPIESDELSVTLEMPAGTTFDRTEKHIEKIVNAANIVQKRYEKIERNSKKESIFKSMSVSIGSVRGENRGPNGAAENYTGSNLGSVKIQLAPSKERSISAGELERAWRKETGQIAGARKIAFESSLIHGGQDINFQLVHRDSSVLESAGPLLRKEIAKLEGMSEVVESVVPGKNEILFKLNDLGLTSGLSPLDLGSQLRGAFYGIEAQRVQRGRNEIKVMVRYPKEDRDNFKVLERIRIKLPTGERVPLKQIAELVTQKSLSTIKRVNGRRVVEVVGDVDENITTPDEVIKKVEKEILPNLLKRFPGLSYKLEGQSKDQRNDLKTLFKNTQIAILLIFLLLAGQLKSYSKPLIILMTVPLGVAGALLGHLLLGHQLSFISFFGMVALTGVVINDSVVLVDYYNMLMAEGRLAYAAAIESIKRRFRPILLTTLTTSLGLLPILSETSIQAKFIVPMAVSLACGLLFASSILIFFVPCLLLVLEDFKSFINKKL